MESVAAHKLTLTIAPNENSGKLYAIQYGSLLLRRKWMYVFCGASPIQFCGFFCWSKLQFVMSNQAETFHTLQKCIMPKKSLFWKRKKIAKLINLLLIPKNRWIFIESTMLIYFLFFSLSLSLSISHSWRLHSMQILHFRLRKSCEVCTRILNDLINAKYQQCAEVCAACVYTVQLCVDSFILFYFYNAYISNHEQYERRSWFAYFFVKVFLQNYNRKT